MGWLYGRHGWWVVWWWAVGIEGNGWTEGLARRRDGKASCEWIWEEGRTSCSQAFRVSKGQGRRELSNTCRCSKKERMPYVLCQIGKLAQRGDSSLPAPWKKPPLTT